MRTALLAILSVAAVWLLLQLWQILLVTVVALMLVGMLNPFVDWLGRRGVERHYATFAVFGALFILLFGLGALTLPQLVTQASDLLARFPDFQSKLIERLQAAPITAPLAASVRALHPADFAKKAASYAMSYGPRVAEIVAYAVTSFFLALYIMLDRDRLRGALFALVPRHYHVRFSRVLVNLETIVGGYMRGQIITSALMAVFTFVVLLIAGVPNALALAIVAGVADVLPYVGALLACGPAFVAALSKGMTTAVIVLAILAAYQEFESRVIVPRIYGRVLRLPAAAVMIALLVGGKLLGILGALLALPIAAAIRMVIAELRVELPGEVVDDVELRQRDAQAEAEFKARAAGAPAVEAAAIATEIVEERFVRAAKDPDEAAHLPMTSGAST